MFKRILTLGFAAMMAIVLGGCSLFDLSSDVGDRSGDVRSQQAGGKGPPEGLKDRALPVLEIEGVIFTDATDDGFLEVGVVNKGLARAVEQKLKELSIPLSSVRIVETKPIVELATLRDKVRPLEGGLQIAFPINRALGICTLGFNAIRDSDGKEGFVTNSHCTKKEFALDGTVHHQPLPNNPIGKEIADPSAFDCGVKGFKCRYSDAAFDERAAGVTATLGSIARPSGVNDGSLDIVGSFSIVGELVGNAALGTTLRKVGRTTGQTEGGVTRSCVDTSARGSKVIRLCQDFVEADVQIVAGGDSGSPVFKIVAGTDVTLYGILWGGSSDGTIFVYSPLSNIEGIIGGVQTGTELGPLTTH